MSKLINQNYKIIPPALIKDWINLDAVEIAKQLFQNQITLFTPNTSGHFSKTWNIVRNQLIQQGPKAKPIFRYLSLQVNLYLKALWKRNKTANEITEHDLSFIKVFIDSVYRQRKYLIGLEGVKLYEAMENVIHKVHEKCLAAGIYPFKTWGLKGGLYIGIQPMAIGVVSGSAGLSNKDGICAIITLEFNSKLGKLTEEGFQILLENLNFVLQHEFVHIYHILLAKRIRKPKDYPFMNNRTKFEKAVKNNPRPYHKDLSEILAYSRELAVYLSQQHVLKFTKNAPRTLPFWSEYLAVFDGSQPGDSIVLNKFIKLTNLWLIKLQTA